MDVREWKPAVIASSKFEAQIIVDLLRNASVAEVLAFSDVTYALDGLRGARANMVFISLANETTALEWVRTLRRANDHSLRKALVLIISSQLTAPQAERFRHAGANAIIGKPVSTATLTGVVKKVLAKPRPFIESAVYVGPCRRAGIVTAGPEKRRRQADAREKADAL